MPLTQYFGNRKLIRFDVDQKRISLASIQLNKLINVLQCNIFFELYCNAIYNTHIYNNYK